MQGGTPSLGIDDTKRRGMRRDEGLDSAGGLAGVVHHLQYCNVIVLRARGSLQRGRSRSSHWWSEGR